MLQKPEPALLPKPFIKCAGGKRGIIKELLSRVPDRYNTYHEPFVGGGALFFSLMPEKSRIADINSEIINCYNNIKHDVESLIITLSMIPYDSSGTHTYNKVVFESLRKLDRNPRFNQVPSVLRAARTIYLNRTCYNGLYRVNSSGQFNTPFGKYKNPKIVDADNLKMCSIALANAEINNYSFEESFEYVHSGDFVYLDPPYIPLSDTANFTSYTADGFSLEDHEALARACGHLHKIGAYFMVSNSNTPEAHKLYENFKIETIAAPRSMNREASKDIIVRNF